MKVIIADDEKWVRKTIISLIPFEKLGLNLLGEASNGIEAYHMCVEQQCDILITDIMMPGLNGLELIEELKKALPDLKIIIITGYSDFEYSRAAIKFGVTDYLLKPIDGDELTQALMKIKTEILEERARQKKETELKAKYDNALPFVSENVLNKLISQNTMTAMNIKKELESCSIYFNREYFTVIVFHWDQGDSSPGSFPSGDQGDGSSGSFPAGIQGDGLSGSFHTGGHGGGYSGSLPADNSFTGGKCTPEKLRELVKEVFIGDDSVTFKSALNLDEVITIINHKESKFEELDNLVQLCLEAFNEQYHEKLLVGISSPTQNLKELPECYIEALYAINLAFWHPEKQIFHFDTGLETVRNLPGKGYLSFNGLPIHLEEQAIANIACGIKLSEYDTAYEYIDNLKEILSGYKYLHPETIKEFFWTLVQSVANRLEIYITFIEHDSIFLNMHPYERLKGIKSFDGLCEYVKGVFTRLCAHYQNKVGASNNIIVTVKKLIQENYQSDITLDKIANYVHMNTTYLSELFKKETGMSFIDYKTLIRINHAKELLRSTNLSSNEISAKIGYTDPKYFIKLFKRITGFTINEFRKGN
ncbi:MAG TPA: response regulator [Clostridiaceae bacterium]|nr:response regulator [Clostridiaceae bacterium]